VLFTYNVEAVTVPPMNVSLGVEYALGHYWVTGRDNTTNARKLVKLNPAGQFVAEYPQQACASTTFGYRDLAFDGTLLVTADECGIDKIDPATGAVVTANIPFPTGVTVVRALAYDQVADEYFTANFGSAITVFRITGLRTLPNPGTPALAFYGMGLDRVSTGNPHLWGWSQNTPTGGTCGTTGFCGYATRHNVQTGAITATFSGQPVGGTQDIAGGADVELIGGQLVLVTLHQATPDSIRGYDLCFSGGPTNTPTRTPSGTPPTATRTPTITLTPCVVGYSYATATGTIVPGTTDAGSACDDCSVAIAIPFPFMLYGVPYSSVNAISNGNLQFVTSNTAFTNACLPAATHGASLHPHWDDLRTDGTTCTGGCGIFTSVSGSAPNRIFNIEYRTTYFSGAGHTNFEVRLYENQATRAFEFIYGTLDQGGTGATTGIQDGLALFTQYQCNTGIANGLQLNWTAGSCGSPTNTPAVTNTPTRTNTPPGATNTPTNTPPGATNSPTNTPPGATNTPTNTPPGPTNTVTPCAMTFTDVNPPDFFYVPVRYLYCAGVISGYADNTFRPYANTTRGQMTKIVVLAFGYPIYTPITPTFIDVPPTHTFYQHIETAAFNNIVSGYSDGTFRPYANVTRGQLSKIDVVAAGWPLINPTVPTFSDVPMENPFYTYIETAFCHGVISGYSDGTFRPFNDATRGQISKIVYESVINTVSCTVSADAPNADAAPGIRK
jgi:hypothetical protein